MAHPDATRTPAPAETYPARPRPIIRATDLGSAQVLKHGDLFLLSDAFGDIHPDSRGLGLYDGDTRVLSCSVLRVAGERPVVLHSDPGGSWRGTVIATNAELRKDPGDKITPGAIARQTISIGRERVLSDIYHERVEIQNHGPVTFDLVVALDLDMDAADIFEVRGYAREHRGELLPVEAGESGDLTFGYVGLDRTTVRTHIAFDPRPTLRASTDSAESAVTAAWRTPLAPGEQVVITWTTCACSVRRRPTARRSSRPVSRGSPRCSGVTHSSPRSRAWPSRRASPSRRSRSSLLTRRRRSMHGAIPSLARSSTNSAPAR